MTTRLNVTRALKDFLKILEPSLEGIFIRLGDNLNDFSSFTKTLADYPDSLKKPAIITDDYVAAILHGEPVLLQQMYQTIFPLISHLIRQHGGSEEDARDVFQDAVMVIYEKGRHPDFQLTSQFTTFFYGICRNLWGNRLQKKSFTEVTIPEDIKYTTADIPEVDYGELEKQKLFDKAFGDLSEDCQRLLLMYFRKLPMEEIAAGMGYSSEGYARRRKFMCKEHLVSLVKSYPEYHELSNTHQHKKEADGKK